MSERLKALADAGVSIWLDDLSRDRLTSNNLADLVANSSVTGVTTNPTIFAGALSKGDAYNAQTAELAARDSTVEDTIKALTTDDVRNACDVLAATSAATNGVDGRVSIEVEPGLAHDAAGTIEQAKQLWAKVNRENALIKIPATIEGLEAIAAVIGAGISVNVTLIFSLERHREVINAYLTGLETAKAAVELPCPYAGTVTEVYASAGDTVEVGTPIIAISTGVGGAAEAAPLSPASDIVPAVATEPDEGKREG